MASAAWVQAVGSVVAIFVAVAIPACQRFWARRDENRDRKLKARSLVFGVSAELLEIEAAYENAKDVVERAKSLGSISVVSAKKCIERAAIVAPPMLISSMHSFYLLGEPAGLTLPQLVTTILQYERMLHRIISGLPTSTSTVNFLDTVKDLEGHLKVIGTLLCQADSELKEFDITPAKETRRMG